MTDGETDDGFSFAAVRIRLFAARCVAALSMSGRPPPPVMFDPRRLASFRHYYYGDGGGEASPRTRALTRARVLVLHFFPLLSLIPATYPFYRSFSLTSFESDRVQGETFISTVLNNFSGVINVIFLLRLRNDTTLRRGIA